MAAIKVPPLGESIVEATVSRWLKKEGDSVAPGDTLVELETDKITVEVPAMSSGVLTKRAHAEGDVVKVDELLAEIDGKRDARSGRRYVDREARRIGAGSCCAAGEIERSAPRSNGKTSGRGSSVASGAACRRRNGRRSLQGRGNWTRRRGEQA
jgi:2-oxoglutarate dehydrogenase E2 component (dihydrolipoamide succinyltransferase)